MRRQTVLEAIEFLASHRSLAVWSNEQQRYLWWAPIHNQGRELGRALSNVVRDYWTAIDQLLQGAECCNCGDHLDDHEQEGAPVCLYCFTTDQAITVCDFVQPPLCRQISESVP